MPVKITFDAGRQMTIITNTFNTGVGRLAGEILNDCNEYCKEDTGMLIASSYIHSRLDEGLLVWQTPYAKRQYWQIRTAYTDVNPQATWRWAEVAKARHKDRWARQLQMLIGGRVP
jgi:hypothetical protein